MNNNTENQNLNTMNGGMMGPNPVPPVTPVGGMTGMQNPGPLGSETLVPPQPPVSMPNPAPTVTSAANVGTIPAGISEPVIGQPMSAPTPQPMNPSPMGGINLAPEGVVVSQPQEPTPVVQPVTEPLMSSTLTEQTVLNPQQSINNGPVLGAPEVPPMGMTPPPMGNDMGMMGGIPVPPQLPPEDNKKEKKKINPTLILLVVVLIVAVGGAVYYFLFMGKSKTSGIVIAPQLTELEAGTDILLDSAASFVKVTGMNINECKVDTNLDSTKVGTYEYIVTCGTKVSGPNKVSVKDTKAPVVELKDVVIPLNGTTYPEDFIESVDDVSECTYEFATAIEEIDTSTSGEYEVTLNIVDAYENATTATAKLIVDENAPVEYLYCEGTGEPSQNYKTAKIFNTYKYGIANSGSIYNMKKIITYTFQNEEDYLSAVDDIKEKKFDDVAGAIKKDPTRFTIAFTQDTDEATLSKEFNLTPFPKTSEEMENYHSTIDQMCFTDIE